MSIGRLLVMGSVIWRQVLLVVCRYLRICLTRRDEIGDELIINGLQNYLVYSNSVLYIRSGGNSRLGGLLLAFATAGVWVAGGTVVGFVPTIVVGS